MAAVQALAPAPAAYSSPAPPLPTAMTAASWGAGALHQRLSAFVKKCLIQQLVPHGAVVCDLYCGRGVDTQNWAEAEIGKYFGVDLSSSALEEAKEQWEKHGKPFAARFCELNPCMVDLEKHLGEDSLSADIVTCLAHLQDCFASEDMVRQLLKNVASLLKPGGFFFGATPDSSTIWYKYQNAVEGAMKAGSLRANGQLPRVKTDLYSISFEDDRFNLYGSRYQLRFTDDTVPPQPQILVHFPSLIRLAEEFGLEFVEIQNLTEFYEDYRVPFAETLQKSCGTLVDAKGNAVVDGKSRLSPIAQDVLSLYTTFIFKKPDPEQRLRALKRVAALVQTPAVTPPVADVKKHKKSSPAVPLRGPGPEELPSKKRKLAASPAIVTSNGSKSQEMVPKQETKTPSKPSKAEPVAGRTFPTPESRGLPSLERVKTESPGTSKPRTGSGRSSQRSSASPSASKAKASGAPSPKPPASGAPSPSSIKPPAGQRTESPKLKVLEGGQRTESPKPKALEGGQRTESPNLRIQELKAEEGVTSNAHGSHHLDKDEPSSGGLRAEASTERPENGSASVPAEPVKRKRVSRWSSEYVPKKTALSAEQLRTADDGGSQVRGVTGPVEGATQQSQHDTRYSRNSRESSGSYQRRSPNRRNGKERTPKIEENAMPERDSQAKEEGEIIPEPPVSKFSSPKRERTTELHYERRTVQRTQSTETATRSEAALETLKNDSEVAPTTQDSKPEESTRPEESTNAITSEVTDQVKSDAPEIRDASSTQNSEAKKEETSQKKDVVDNAEGVVTNAGTNGSAASVEPPPSKDSDADFEKGSKMSRDSPRHSKAGSESAGKNNHSKRNFEPEWETKPQRYTQRRTASQNMSDGAFEPSSPWPSRGSFPGKASREQQGRGSVFQHRMPFVPPFVPPRPPLRGADRGRGPVVLPTMQGGLPGLLGAAPAFGDRRFDAMGPPEGSRGYSHSPSRGPRSLRGSLYNERAASAGPRGPPDFPGEGSYSAGNGLGGPWDDGRPRNR